ncbi:MAG: hypothetical protein MjAS7_1925 [Metallosphaera javensis (ex Sakai et al. 2022)]|nr:MAG: hypothetical protein MjAS7_1925 [Metallosphaera javensis (ex Sakai et al. 2022)]
MHGLRDDKAKLSYLSVTHPGAQISDRLCEIDVSQLTP